ncbi:DUF5807 family protein [Halorientalis halophila]|uniref:DUF5807 family protein n=1 Tax=Halorientalis halophila TaxID=3108499 RepID=UPI003008FBCC
MDETREQFLAGERPDDVLLYFDERAVDGMDRLAKVGESTDDGVVLVLDGEEGRTAFQRATGVDPMTLAQSAMGNEGEITDGCTGGNCPDAAEGGDHYARFVFAFAEAENEDVGGLYAEGDVVHAYAQCECGTTYSEKWVAEV